MLALLLVLSQQLGMAHAVSHWSDYRHTGEQVQLQDADATLSAGLALDHNCSQCLAFAQLASAVNTPDYTFPACASRVPHGLVPGAPSLCQRTTCAYQSRAPPLA